MAGVPSISGGSHALLVTALSGPALVVERVITEPAGQSVVTSSMLGLQGEALANEWFASVTAADGDGPALVILNVSPDPTSIDVSSFGPGGPEPVADLTGITLQANERREIRSVMSRDGQSRSRPPMRSWSNDSSNVTRAAWDVCTLWPCGTEAMTS